MAPDERRRAIVDAVVPLLLQHGDDVTTKQIAEAAGIAEGTIFRVFPDKAALLMAVAEETIEPVPAAGGRWPPRWRAASACASGCWSPPSRCTSGRSKVVAVMMALRGVWMTQAERGREQHPPGRRSSS